MRGRWSSAPPVGDPFLIAANALLAAGWPEDEIVESPRGAAVNEFGRSAFLDVWGFEWTANVTLTHTTRRAIVRVGDPVVALKRAMAKAREIAAELAA